MIEKGVQCTLTWSPLHQKARYDLRFPTECEAGDENEWAELQSTIARQANSFAQRSPPSLTSFLRQQSRHLQVLLPTSTPFLDEKIRP